MSLMDKMRLASFRGEKTSDQYVEVELETGVSYTPFRKAWRGEGIVPCARGEPRRPEQPTREKSDT
jgi:hypothetical protein